MDPAFAEMAVASGRKQMARVAFIGLGNMGGRMAANLAKAGHDVAPSIFAQCREAIEKGRLPARRQRRRSDRQRRAIITMLPARAP